MNEDFSVLKNMHLRTINIAGEITRLLCIGYFKKRYITEIN